VEILDLQAQEPAMMPRPGWREVADIDADQLDVASLATFYCLLNLPRHFPRATQKFEQQEKWTMSIVERLQATRSSSI
jgi:hypothetical protein